MFESKEQYYAWIDTCHKFEIYDEHRYSPRYSGFARCKADAENGDPVAMQWFAKYVETKMIGY